MNVSSRQIPVNALHTDETVIDTLRRQTTLLPSYQQRSSAEQATYTKPPLSSLPFRHIGLHEKLSSDHAIFIEDDRVRPESRMLWADLTSVSSTSKTTAVSFLGATA